MNEQKLTLGRVVLAALGVDWAHEPSGLTVWRGARGESYGFGVETAYVSNNFWPEHARTVRIGRLRIAAWNPGGAS